MNTFKSILQYKTIPRITNWFRAIFSLDLRALAILRIWLALVIIIDLTMWALDLRAFFTDSGILPTDLLMANYQQENMRAFHSLSWSYRRQFTLLILNYAIALALLVWRKSRVMHILAWAFFCSLNARNPIINSGADSVMRVLLFWAMFLPTHIRRSIDRKDKPKPEETNFLSRASAGFIIQVASIYVRNYVVKTDPQRKVDFTATYTALSIDVFRTAFGTRLYQFPWLLKFITQFRVYLEWRWVLLFLIPRKQWRRRTLACLAFIAVHFWMAITLKIGYFPRTCILARAVLLPKEFWSLFHKPAKDITSQSYRKRSYWISLFLILCLIYITLRNLRTTNFDKREQYFPRTLNKYGFMFRLDQYRSMFSPYPLEDDWWFVVQWTTADYQKVNLLVPNSPVTYDKPTDFDLLYPGEKRRKLFLNYRGKSYGQYRPAYLQRQCATRNKKNPYNPIVSASMEYVVERTKPNYQVQTGEIVMLQTVECE